MVAGSYSSLSIFSSMDWFKGKYTGKAHILIILNGKIPMVSGEDFPLNQSIDFHDTK